MIKLILIVPLIKGIYMLLLMLQLDHYEIGSIFRYLFRYYFKTIFIIACYFLIFTIFNVKILNYCIYLLILIASLFKTSYIMKLKITKRMIRLITVIISMIGLTIYCNRCLDSLILIIFLLPFYIFMANLLLFPLEHLIKTYYKSTAKKRLTKINPYTICITGSFGKTTLKNILSSLYQDSYLTTSSKASYNTPMGLTKTILNDLSPLTELLILEAGATHTGDIKEITKMVNPDLGIITQIGPQHLQSFKSMNNIVKTKWELPENMEHSGKVILNESSPYLNGVKAYNLSETIGVNTNSSKVSYQNVVCNDLITSFDITVNQQVVLNVSTKMLGLHNVENITMAYAVKLVLDHQGFFLSDEDFKMRVFELVNPKNRLSIKEESINGVKYRFLDDSYNANELGFISAINTLKHLEGIKVIITPFIVDSGAYTNQLAKNISINLKDLDEVLLINNKQIIKLKKYLKQNNINFIVFNSLNAALKYLYQKYASFNATYINVLLENDLPDNYIMR